MFSKINFYTSCVAGVALSILIIVSIYNSDWVQLLELLAGGFLMFFVVLIEYQFKTVRTLLKELNGVSNKRETYAAKSVYFWGKIYQFYAIYLCVKLFLN